MVIRIGFICLVILAVASIESAMGKLEYCSHSHPFRCSRSYTVQQGDTCDTISAAKNVSTYQLAHVNNGTIDAKCDNLKAKETLCLGTKGQDCKTTYVVQTGDTCDAIINKTRITKCTLLANNPNLKPDCSFIYSGEVLCVAGYDVYPNNITST